MIISDLEILAEQDRDLGAMARQLTEALEREAAAIVERDEASGSCRAYFAALQTHLDMRFDRDIEVEDIDAMLKEHNREFDLCGEQLGAALEHNTALRAEVARLTEALADLGAGVAL